MKRLFPILAMALLLVPIAFAASDAFTGALKNAADIVRDFISTGYDSYYQLVDFVLFFILFTVVFMLGLNKVFGEQNRQVKTLAVVLALIVSFALVKSGITLKILAPYARFLLFVVMVLVLYALLLKFGMENHKIMAIIIAVLLTLLAFYVANSLFKEGKPLFEVPDLFGSGDKPAFVGLPAIKGFFVVATSDFADSTGTMVDQAAEEKKISAYAKNCSAKDGTVYARTTASVEWAGVISNQFGTPEEKEAYEKNLALANQRLARIQGIIPAKEEAAEVLDKSIPTYRFYSLTCRDARAAESRLSGGSGSTPSCQELMDFNFEQWFREIGTDIQRYLVGTGNRDVQVLEQKLAKCRIEAGGSTDPNVMRNYYDAMERYHTAIGEKWFEAGEFSRALPRYQSILDNTPIGSDYHRTAIEGWHSLVESHYEKQLADASAIRDPASRARELIRIKKEIKAAIDARDAKRLYPIR
ncbi:MAG: hypothetical protein ABH879_09155 [archaeon]